MGVQTPGIIRHYPALSGIIRHYPALSGIITHFCLFPRAKTCRPRPGAAILAACLLGGLPVAATAANSGGTVEGYNSNRFYRYVGDGSGDVIIESENDTYGGNSVTLYGVFGGRQDSSGDVENRTIIIGDATHAPNIGEAFGGDTLDGSANNNTLTFQNGTIAGGIKGGFCGTGSADHNTVTITGNAKASGGVQGGKCRRSASWNSVNIEGSAEVSGDVLGGDSEYSGSVAEHNTVTISGGSVKGDVIGGDPGDNSKATHNTVTISGGSVSQTVYGGQANYGTASGNTVTINGGSAGDVRGGHAPNGTASGNTVTISGGSVDDSVYGGEAYRGTASGNTITINGGSAGDVRGGHAPNGTASGNTVTINGGSVGENVYGGYTGGAGSICKATDNTVRITGTPTFSSTTKIYGGFSSNSVVVNNITTGNSLEILNSGITVAGVGNFAALAFTLPDTITNGGTMLTATGSANFPAASTSLVIKVTGKPALKENDTITLIAAGSLAIKDYPKSLSAGGFDFALSDDGKNLIAKVTKAPPPYTITEAFDPAEGTLSCKPNPVTTAGGSTQCDAVPAAGYTFATLTIDPPGNATLGTCDASGCELTGVVGDVKVTGIFKALPPSSGTATAVPTVSDIGLLLSSIALAGAAAPALRRRKKQGKKAYTHR